MKLLSFLILFFILGSTVKAQDIIDLGSDGETCELSTQPLPIVIAQVPQRFNDPSFTARLQKWGNSSYSQPRPDILKSYVGKSIFVFGAKDAASEASASRVKADFGLCVDYSNLNDLSLFKEKTKITFPIQLANDYIIQTLNLKSFPLLIKVKEDSVEYSTDF